MLEENKSLNYNLGNEKIIANIKKYGILKNREYIIFRRKNYERKK